MVSLPQKKPPRKGRNWLLLAGIAALALAAVYALFQIDMNRTSRTLNAGSAVVPTRHGIIEYAEWGTGPVVLVLHGAGGGYDQGRLIPQAFAGGRYRWISVSRFGYLRSVLPEDASTRAQAETLADLLDSLKVDRAAIIAMSGGVPPALQFAEHFPDRAAALVLLSSAPITPLTAADQKLPIPAWIYQLLFKSDFFFWAIVRLSPDSLDRFFDISPEARAILSGRDRGFVDGLVAAFLPVTRRIPGLENEGAAIAPDAVYNLHKITSPTLVIHAKDDRINPFPIGEHVARGISGARFLPIDTGGHLLLGHHDNIRSQITEFLQKNTIASH
jgi:2-hydroxy-6-oxonona-2,4-dienedioate hydrolase